MDNPNAFIGKREQPTAGEIYAALGSSAPVWQQLLDELAKQGVDGQVWKSFSPKYGWSMQLKLKKRTILHLAPCTGCFRVAVILGDRAVKAAKQGDVPRKVLKLIEDAPRYPEGTGVRLIVNAPKDLVPIRTLVAIKLAN